MSRWMIYGATGFSGRLIAKRAKELGLTPVLAGRSADAVAALAKELGFEFEAFALDDSARVKKSIAGHAVVLHCAGPFTATAAPMIDACIAAGVSYLDITGELDVFAATLARDAEARKAGVALVSGVGCDVVPSDGLAATLAHALPGGDSLELACAFATTPSAGTLATLFEQIPHGGAVYRGGVRVKVRHAEYTRRVPFPDGERHVASAPWGDLLTAQRATGIPDVTVYLTMPRAVALYARYSTPFAKLLAWRPIQRFLRWITGRLAAKDQPKKDGWLVWWGEVRKGNRRACAYIKVPDPYTFTIDSTLAAVKRVLAGGIAPGAHTPSQAFGMDFAVGLRDVKLTWLTRPETATATESARATSAEA